jgi:effector-binding domain-containing protein
MIDEPVITETSSQATAAIRLCVPRSEIRNVMGPGLAEIRAALAAQSIQAAGPWFTHHFRMNPEVFDYEICVPAAAPVTPVGRVESGERPAMKVIRTVYHGGYEGLGAAWAEFDRWIAGQGLTAGPDLWECYVAGPESGSDPAGWRTEFTRQNLGA